MPYLSIYDIEVANSTHRDSLTMHHMHYYFTSVFLFVIFGILFYLYSLMRRYRNTGTACYKCTPVTRLIFIIMQTSKLCSACSIGRPITDPESGEIICTNCGYVFSDKAQDSRAEWRTFSSGGKSERVRVGSPISLTRHDMGLATIIGKSNMDSSGQKLDPSMHSMIHRLRTWNFRTQIHTSAERNLMRALNELAIVKDKLGLSDVMIEKTAYIYRKANEKHLTKGRSVSAILAAAIYIACREMGASRTLADIAAAMDVKRKIISRSHRVLINELDVNIPPVDLVKCIARIANKVNIDEKTKRMAMHTMIDLVDREISAGKSPMGLAASVLYTSCLRNDENTTQKNIAEAAGVSEVTIRNRIKDLRSKGVASITA
jgi:transcription initiation factor TFIIB